MRYIYVALVCLLAIVLFAVTYEVNASRNDYVAFRKLSQQDAVARLNAIADAHGPEAAWDYLKQAYMTPDGSFIPGMADGHMLAHTAGALFYRKLGPDGITKCDSSFTNGCYHGFVAAMVLDRGITAIAQTRTACAAAANVGVCIHGVGHGLVELEPGEFDKVIVQCALFGVFASHCVDGAVMEQDMYVTKQQLLEDPWYPCNSLPAGYQVGCASAKPSQLHSVGETVPQIARFCASAATSDMETECQFMIGYAIVEGATNVTTDTIEQQCGLLSGASADQCLYGAADLTVNEKPVDWQATALALCARISDATVRDRCVNEAQGPK